MTGDQARDLAEGLPALAKAMRKAGVAELEAFGARVKLAPRRPAPSPRGDGEAAEISEEQREAQLEEQKKRRYKTLLAASGGG